MKFTEEKLEQAVIELFILANPFFFKEADWIPVPVDWKTNIVQGKTYDTDDLAGRELWYNLLRKTS